MTDTVIIAGLSLFVDDVPVIICALVNLDVVVNGVVVAASDAVMVVGVVIVIGVAAF